MDKHTGTSSVGQGSSALSTHVLCMGVSGTGKSYYGKKLARHFSCPFLEGDTLHSKENKAKMTQGIALSDSDRWGWLLKIRTRLEAGQGSMVLSCSALKKSYRDFLQDTGLKLFFLCLHAPYEVILSRMKERDEHFMPVSLLESQYVDLELLAKDERGVLVDLTHDEKTVLETCLRSINDYCLSI